MVWLLQVLLLLIAAVALILNLLASRDANADLRAIPLLERPLDRYLWVNVVRVWCRLVVSVLVFIIAALIYLDVPPPPAEHALAVMTFGQAQFVRHVCIGALVVVLAFSTLLDWRLRVRLRRQSHDET